MIRLHAYPDDPSLVTALAQQIGAGLAAAIEMRGSASLAVSGGSTPKSLFAALSHQPIAWQQVQITLVDERWVDEASPDSNARLVRNYLLCNAARAATFTELKTPDLTAAAGVDQVEARIAPLFPLDIVVLGLGHDGHTASWHPGAATLQAVLNPSNTRYCGVVVPVSALHERMTLTLSAVLTARQIYLHVVGETKKKVLDVARQPGPIAVMPVRAVLQQDRVPVDIYYAPETD